MAGCAASRLSSPSLPACTSLVSSSLSSFTLDDTRLPAHPHRAPPVSSTDLMPLPPPSIPRLPPEIHGRIIQLSVDDLHSSATFKARETILCRLASVSTEWAELAQTELERGRIYVDSARRSSRLRATLEESPRFATRIRSLCFADGQRQRDCSVETVMLWPILRACKSLQHLSLHRVYGFQIAWLEEVPSELPHGGFEMEYD